MLYEDVICKEIGLGTFGKVFKCRDKKYDDIVAVKVVRGVKKYVESARIEADILGHVYDRQKEVGANCCVKLYSHFSFDGKVFGFVVACVHGSTALRSCIFLLSRRLLLSSH